MKRFTIISCLLMFGLLFSMFVCFPVKSSDGLDLPRQLTNNTANDLNPSVIADGSKIAFQSDIDGDYEIFVVNSDGTGLTQLTSNTANDMSPSISGDGTKIAYESGGEIFLMNSDGSGLTQLTSNSDNDVFSSINYDGSKITFYSYVDGGSIFVVNSDGTGLLQLANNIGIITFPFGNFGGPSICGDGSKIAFHSNGEVFVINSDGSGLIRLTNNDIYDGCVSFSSDGSKIAFESQTVGWTNVAVINSDGSGFRLLTNNNAADLRPSICGDGSKVAFYSDTGIFVINSDGTGLTQLTTKIGSYTGDPRICVEGTTIVFEAYVDGDHEIFVIGSESSGNEIELSAGWNMISFPVLPDDASFSSIFSEVSFYQVLTWDGSSYVTPTVAEAGVGYWILVLEDTTISINEPNPVISYELELAPGWSMIGSIYQETVDADTVFPGFYQLLTWNGTSYVTSTVIEPGKGYWALVLEPITITVTGG